VIRICDVDSCVVRTCVVVAAFELWQHLVLSWTLSYALLSRRMRRLRVAFCRSVAILFACCEARVLLIRSRVTSVRLRVGSWRFSERTERGCGCVLVT